MDTLFDPSASAINDSEQIRRRREKIIIAILIIVVSILTFIETRISHFGTDIPVSSTILLFILININLLLLLLLIFLVFRNVVKLYFDRRRNVAGARLRTKLLVAFVSLTLMPAAVLFIFSVYFISTSIAFWFNAPVDQALQNSLAVGRSLYEQMEINNKFFIDRAAFQIQSRKLMEPGNETKLANYVQVVQRAFNLDGVEVYQIPDDEGDAPRLAYAMDDKVSPEAFNAIKGGTLKRYDASVPVITETYPVIDGELVRTIGTIPFHAPLQSIQGFLVISVLIPTDLAGNLASLSRGYGEYQQVKLLKKPVQITYFIALSIVGLLVVFCSVIFAFYIAKSITIPIMDLAEGTRRVAEGDLSVHISSGGDDEIGILVESFNRMTRDLGISREQLSLSTRMLHHQNQEIEERRRYMEIVLKNVSAGVVSIDPDAKVTTINTSAEKMLGLTSTEAQNRPLHELMKEQRTDAIDRLMAAIFSEEDEAMFGITLTLDNRLRSLSVHYTRLRDDAGKSLGAVLVFDDLTELEKAQRMAAWREVARRIAHEVKNPLTPISLSAQRLKRKYGKKIDDPVFEECTRTIIDHVDLIRNLVNEFAAFARFPTADPKPCKLAEIVDESVALYREGHPDIRFKAKLGTDIPTLLLDRQQMKQAMINLLDNAIAAIKNHGRINIQLTHHPDDGRVRLEIADNGKGITNAEKSRLFEPYFSTKTSGMGLGLAIVNSIIADHRGTITVADNSPKGAKFIIELPVEGPISTASGTHVLPKPAKGISSDSFST